MKKQITAYPNQRIVTIKKAPCDKNHKYGMVNIDCMEKAMKELSPTEFKIYMYMVVNQDQYQFGYSPKGISDEINADQKYIQRSFKKFIEKGYLVSTGSSKYDFYEDPDMGKLTPSENNSGVKNTPVIGESVPYDTGNKAPIDGVLNTQEIIQDNINNTIDSTEKSEPTNQNPKKKLKVKDIDVKIKNKVCDLMSQRYKYGDIQTKLKREAPYLTGKLIYEIIEEYKENGKCLDESGEYSLDRKFATYDGNNFTIRWLLSARDPLPLEYFNCDESDNPYYMQLTDKESGYGFDKDQIKKWFQYVEMHPAIYPWDKYGNIDREAIGYK